MYAEAEKVKDTFAKEKANKNYCQLKRNDSFNEFKFLSAIVSKNDKNISSVDDVSNQDKISILFKDGYVNAIVHKEW